jgi:divalent metal cation (Fe/Co/Zn/Cd) transporter
MSPEASPLLAFSACGPDGETRVHPSGSPAWRRTAARARMLSWLTLGWLGVEAGGAIAAALIAGSVALLGFGLDSGVEALASIIVIWRLSGSRRSSETAERRGQRLVAVSFLLLGPYIAVEALLDLASGAHPETSLVGIALTGFTVIFEPFIGVAKRRLGRALGSATVGGEGTQNLLCAAQAAGVLMGLVTNTLFDWAWLDPAVALLIAAIAIREGVRSWRGGETSCACGCPTELEPFVASIDHRAISQRPTRIG